MSSRSPARPPGAARRGPGVRARTFARVSAFALARGRRAPLSAIFPALLLALTGAAPGAPSAAQAAPDTAPRRLLAAHEQLEWRGVGRLNIKGGGYCTATLLSETLAITAAHCLFDGRRRRNDAELWFAAGYRDGNWEAIRQARRTAVHPEFDPPSGNLLKVSKVGTDLALIELDAPVLGTAIPHYPPAAFPGQGAAVALTSYGRGRDNALSLQEPCRVMGRHEDIAALSCEVVSGSSGSPVFRRGAGGAPELVAVISLLGREGSWAAVIEDTLPRLRAGLAEYSARRKSVRFTPPGLAAEAAQTPAPAAAAPAVRSGGGFRASRPGGGAASSAPRLGGGSAWQGRRPPE